MEHHDKSRLLNRLNRIEGQVRGVSRMIEEGRYCMDIVHQIRSIMAALRSAEGLVMERHVRHCVREAIEAKDSRLTEGRIQELLALFQKR